MTSGELTIEGYIRLRGPSLQRMAYLLTGDRHLAEDLLQVALARVWPRWQRVAAAGDPDAYVRRCVLNGYLSWRRTRRATEVVTPIDALPEVPVPGGAEEAVATRLTVLRALARLPRRQRATVVLRYWEDLSEAQTAAALGCSTGTVKSQSVKALASLRRDLGPAILEGDHAR